MARNTLANAAKRIARTLREIVHEDYSGNAIIPTALALPVLIGFIGLAVDVSSWEMSQRKQQGAVDQAAFSAATAAVKGATVQQATIEAQGVLARLGFTGGSDSVTITVNNPPSSGAYTGNTSAWEVRVSKPTSKYFSGIFMSGSAPTLLTRAVALKGVASVPGSTTNNPGNGCILSLAPTGADATYVSNNALITNTTGCTVYTNSTDAGAFHCEENCLVNPDTFTRGGEVWDNNSISPGVNNAGYTWTGTTNPFQDPYGLSAPSSSTMGSCITAAGVNTATTTVTQNNIASGTTIPPGRYCNGIDFSGRNNTPKVINMSAGTYYLEYMFRIGNNATLNATAGTTIVIVGDYCLGQTNRTCQHSNEGFGNGATINLTAPTSGPYAGIAMHFSSSVFRTQPFANNNIINVQGVFYSPNQKVLFRNNNVFNPAKCAKIIAWNVHIENNTNMGSNCAGTGVNSIGDTTTTATATPAVATRLVE